MRIEVVGDGHVFQGTPRQILMQMKSLAFGAEHMTMREYIEGNVANIRRGFGIEFKLTGDTDDELAESFLQQMLAGGHARRL
jgi:predicted RNA-binding protein with PIN domain